MRIIRLTSIILIHILFVQLSGCAENARLMSSDTSTNLKDGHNVAALFGKYQRENTHCSIRGNQKRVILTGFKRFDDKNRQNASGRFVELLADEGFTPNRIDTKMGFTPASESLSLQGPGPLVNGGRVKQRVITLNGEEVDFCFITVSVTWDLAAAIILHEAELFRPDVIVMTGEGYRSHFETTGRNRASAYADGDSPDGGERDPLNIPFNEGQYKQNSQEPLPPVKILEQFPLQDVYEATWNADKLLASTRPLLDQIARESMDPKTAANKDANPPPATSQDAGDYLCNAVLYTVGKGTSGSDLLLASGQLAIKGMRSNAKIGFFHYPWQVRSSIFPAMDVSVTSKWLQFLMDISSISLSK